MNYKKLIRVLLRLSPLLGIKLCLYFNVEALQILFSAICIACFACINIDVICDLYDEIQCWIWSD